jgi:hypothetical protein
MDSEDRMFEEVPRTYCWAADSSGEGSGTLGNWAWWMDEDCLMLDVIAKGGKM